MTGTQEETLKAIKEDADFLIESKYRKGDAEHGGELINMEAAELLDNAISEAVDQMTYLLALRYRLFGRVPR